MAGKLVGEVIDAVEHGLTLSDVEFRVLIAIAEKCHHESRQGSVRTDRLVIVSGRKKRQLERTLARLKERGFIRVISAGKKSHGVLHAPVYEMFGPAIWVAAPNDSGPATQDGGTKPDLVPPFSDLVPPFEPFGPAIGNSVNSDDSQYDGSYYVTNDGLYDASSPQSGELRAREQNEPDYSEIFGSIFNSKRNGNHQRALSASIDADAIETYFEHDSRLRSSGLLTIRTERLIDEDAHNAGLIAMAETHKANELAKLQAAFPEHDWAAS